VTLPVARLVLPALRWDPATGFDHAAIDRALALGVGGFIVFGLNAIQGGRGVPARTLRALVIDTTARAGRPLLWASDLERGAGQQVAGCTELPPPAALASLGDPAVSRWAGWLTAREAHATGLNWVLAPVCDLDLEPRNPIVQTRSFGADPGEVARHVTAWIEGCRAGGALACAKHWPGHGRTTADSHDVVPTVDAGADALAAHDGRPFRAAIAAGVDGVMTAHVAYPALDPSGTPATFSPPILSRLRAEGFDGLIATDALMMDAAAGKGPGAVAVDAIAAGCDLLCYPPDVEAAVAALDAAVARDPRLASLVRDALRRYEAALATQAALTHRDVPAPYRSADALADALVERGMRRGAIERVTRPIAVQVVDDDLGGRWPASPTTHLAEALAAGKGLAAEGTDRAFHLLAIFAEPRASKGRAGLSAEHRRRVAELASQADLVVLFGHPRLAEEVPGDRPLLVAWHRQRLMQEGVARWLLARRA
jgi:beta-glucosidase-like glycosyl hydrolase